jgi:hypothetical protein
VKSTGSDADVFARGADGSTSFTTNSRLTPAFSYVLGLASAFLLEGPDPTLDFKCDLASSVAGSNTHGFVLTALPASATGYVSTLSFRAGQSAGTAGVAADVTITVGRLSPADGTIFRSSTRTATVAADWTVGQPLVTVDFKDTNFIIYQVSRQR